ncbi:MAG: 3-phosphoshikimate 1-carboxyvinyltransferase [Solobacterium sp.]|nr:3-phosphoshikimate 1-carboxyvinyltransferase [Solobacterium sp.]
MHISIQKGQPKESYISLPASKSLMHRYLIAAALANGESSLYHFTHNEDTLATMHALKKLGASFIQEEDRLLVRGISSTIHLEDTVIDAHESGSTLRFLIPLFSLSNQRIKFIGKGRLLERPQSVYEKIFTEEGLSFKHTLEYIEVEGALKAGKYSVEGNISSQFITGLFFTLPMCEGDSEIEILPPIASASYLNLTIDVLSKAGIKIRQEGNRYYIKGKQNYQPFDIDVPADDSQAAFFIALAQIVKVPIHLVNMDHDSKQGDHIIKDIVEKMGMDVEEKEKGYCFKDGELKGIEIDLEDCPDLGPILFALATQAKGTTTFLHTERLRIKESDRIQAMKEELAKLGYKIEDGNDWVKVYGHHEGINSRELYGHNDHRIVMALSILSTLFEEEIYIDRAEAIEKSYPKFFKDLEKVGIQIKYDI